MKCIILGFILHSATYFYCLYIKTLQGEKMCCTLEVCFYFALILLIFFLSRDYSFHYSIQLGNRSDGGPIRKSVVYWL